MQKPEEVVRTGEPRHYAIFLSYRHSDNKAPGRQWATWLHQMLESYEIPADLAGTLNGAGNPVPASLYPVFRDEEELPADADLTRNIRRALECSQMLVVICSPAAAQSHFVAEEIRYFKELGKADRVLALMIAGEPNASEDLAKQGQGIAPELECLPEPLRRGVAQDDGTIDWNARTEPLAADVRPNGQPIEGWTNSAAYREQLRRDAGSSKSDLEGEARAYEERLELAKLKVIAGALGVPLGVLTQRDKAMQLARARKRARTLHRWLAVLALLVLVSILAGAFAWQKQREAARERDAVEQARRDEEKQRALAQQQSEQRRQLLVEAARSDRLAAEDQLARDEQPAAFASLARSLVYDATTPAAAEKAVAALNVWRFGRPSCFLPPNGTFLQDFFDFSPDGSRAVVTDPKGPAKIVDTKTGAVLFTLESSSDGTCNPRFSSDGRTLVSACNDDSVRIWDAESGRVLRKLSGHEDAVSSIVFSSDNQRILTASQDGTARLWDAATGRCRVVFRGHTGAVRTALFSRDSSRVVTRSDKDLTTRIWESASGKCLLVLSGEQKSDTVTFTPDSLFVLSEPDATGNIPAKLWDIRTGKMVRSFPGRYGATISPDGEQVATGSAEGFARIWQLQTGKLLHTLSGHEREVFTPEYSQDSRRILTTGIDNNVRAWDSKTGQLLLTIKGAASAGFSPDGERIITEAGKHAQDRSARIWETATARLLAVLDGHENWVFQKVFSPNGTRVATLADEAVRVWETDPGALVVSLPGREDDSSQEVRISRDGRRVLARYGERKIRVWDAQNAALLTTIKLESGQDFFSQNIEFSPDGDRILTVSGAGPQVWNARSGKLVATLPRHSQRATNLPQGAVVATGLEDVNDLAFAPDGRQVVVVYQDGTATLADSETGRNVIVLGEKGDTGALSARFSADGAQLLIGYTDGALRIWDTRTGKLLTSHEMEQQKTAPAASASDDAEDDAETRGENAILLGEREKAILLNVCSADGQRFARISRDGTTRELLDTKSGARLATLEKVDFHFKYAANAQFSPDHRRFAVGDSEDVFLWDVASGKLLAHVDGAQSAEFSPDGRRILTVDKTSALICDAETGKRIASLPCGDFVRSTHFAADGEHVVTGSDDQTARIWTILPPGAGLQPAWFSDFLLYMAQNRLNADGELEPIKREDWLALRTRLQKVLHESASGNSAYLRVLRRFVHE